MRDVSTTIVSTDVAFEIRDDDAQTACLGGAIEHDVLGRSSVTLRDDRGVSYPHSDKGENGISIGQNEFGFFGRRVAFERLPGTARRAFLGVSGALGDWDVPIELAPITETGAATVHDLSATAIGHDVMVRLSRVAFSLDEIFIEVEATAIQPGMAIAGIGEIQPAGDEHAAVQRHIQDELDRRGTRSVERRRLIVPGHRRFWPAN